MHRLALLLMRAWVEPAEVPPPPDPRELELVWRAPPGCPTKADIEGRVRALLPDEPNGDGILHVEGDVTLDDAGAHLVLVSTFGGVQERRELESPQCTELGEATAVLLAVALEPGAPAREPTRERDVSTPPPVAPPIDPSPVDPIDAIAPVSSPVAAPQERRARVGAPQQFGLRIAGGIEVGAQPPPAAAVQLAALVLWPRARLEIHGAYLAPRKHSASESSARFQLGAAGARGCARLFARAIELPLCAGGEAGVTRADTLGSLRKKTVNGRWVAAVAAVGVARAWGPVAIWASVEGLATVAYARFKVDRKDLVFRPFPVSARAFVGIELRGTWKRRGRGQ